MLLFDVCNYLCNAAIVAAMTKGRRAEVQLATSKTEDLARGIRVDSLWSYCYTRER